MLTSVSQYPLPSLVHPICLLHAGVPTGFSTAFGGSSFPIPIVSALTYVPLGSVKGSFQCVLLWLGHKGDSGSDDEVGGIPSFLFSKLL